MVLVKQGRIGSEHRHIINSKECRYLQSLLNKDNNIYLRNKLCILNDDYYTHSGISIVNIKFLGSKLLKFTFWGTSFSIAAAKVKCIYSTVKQMQRLRKTGILTSCDRLHDPTIKLNPKFTNSSSSYTSQDQFPGMTFII